MNTYEINFSKVYAKVKLHNYDARPIANIYKVKRQAAFVLRYIGTTDTIIGDAEQMENYIANRGICLIPMNKEARKYLHFIIEK